MEFNVTFCRYEHILKYVFEKTKTVLENFENMFLSLVDPISFHFTLFVFDPSHFYIVYLLTHIYYIHLYINISIYTQLFI